MGSNSILHQLRENLSKADFKVVCAGGGDTYYKRGRHFRAALKAFVCYLETVLHAAVGISVPFRRMNSFAVFISG